MQNNIHKLAEQLLVHNIQINGLKTLLYCNGLSASRYIEYAAVFTFLSQNIKQNSLIVEVGCGHSILPSFWQRSGINVVVVDRNKDALKWQIEKNKAVTGSFLSAVLADMRFLPFKEGSIGNVSCVSAIEHIPEEGDCEAAFEIGRILKNDGVGVLSFPFSSNATSQSQHHWATGIPPLMRSLFGFCLPTILEKFHVDRTGTYFERAYSHGEMKKRIINSSKGIEEDYFTLVSGQTIKFVHGKIVPTGVFTVLEYFIAKFISVDKNVHDADAIMLKLRKP